ncbi:hypothetical protein A0J61_02094 [Choanephora cucurbitarum]|uniref:NET domain-containing protein n=1 Tax=Choanephora cucurbitarum TaxID=101091 RepID=A0A1C7NL24_9FUNG|nr:hypothetical protein A0J61_02094 [Choanephora cucurbitarum]
MNSTIINEPLTAKRRTSSSTSSLSSYSSSSEEEDHNTFSTFYSQKSSMDSSGDEEEVEENYNTMKPSLMHRRQMEETILEKITQQLDAEKLPGILSIIAEKHEEHVEEVEIDLAKLNYIQLEQILLYIEACFREKNGGPKVKLADFVPKPVKTKPKPKNNRQRQKRRRSSLVGAGHVVNGSSTSRLSETHGPISMSTLTQLEREEKEMASTRRRNNRRKGPKKNKSRFNKMSPPVKKLPKRKTALHKRRLLEEMIQPSLSEEEEEEDDTKEGGIIIFGNEQMDFAVKDNQTIVHTSPSTGKKPIVPAIDYKSLEDDEDDEMIDIML